MKQQTFSYVALFFMFCFILTGCNLLISLIDGGDGYELEISPQNTQVPVGDHINYFLYRIDKQTKYKSDVTNDALWYSSDPAIAGVPYPGYVETYYEGTVTITAEYEGEPISTRLFIGSNAGLIAEFKFDGNCDDSSGNGASAVPLGTVTYTAGKDTGSAVYLNGVNAYIETSILWDYVIPSFTISAWINLDGITPGKEHMIFGNSSDYASGYGFWAEYYQEVEGFKFYNIGESLISGPITCSENIWHHVVFVYDDFNAMTPFKFYMDGSFICESYTFYNPDGVSNLYIGAAGSALPAGLLFKGCIDQVMIWERPLSETEVIDLYNSQMPK